MDDQDDIDFNSGLKSVRKSTSRRRKELADDDNLESVLDSLPGGKSNPEPKPRSKPREELKELKDDFKSQLKIESSSNSKAVNGWGENDIDFNQTNTARSRRRDPSTGFSLDFNPEQPQETKITSKKINQRELNKYEELEIPEIPDLEENIDTTEDMAFKVAEAPDVQVHQISTYKELDKEFFKEKAFQFLEGNIDVSLLHCGLSTEQLIAEEEDTIWEWNKLFTEVVSVLSVNKENESEPDFGNDYEIPKIKSDTMMNIITKERDI